MSDRAIRTLWHGINVPYFFNGDRGCITDVRKEQVAAVEAFGLLKCAASVGPLSYALGNPEKSIRQAAITALAQVGGNAAVEVLSLATVANSDSTVRGDAVKALGELGESTVVAPLLAALFSYPLSNRSIAVAALNRLQNEQLREGLTQALSQPNINAQIAAFEVIGYYAHDQDVLRLCTEFAAQHANKVVRQKAQKAKTQIENIIESLK